MKDLSNNDISRRIKVFRFWALAWATLGLGMALSISVVPLMVTFAVGHFTLLSIVLYYAIRLSNEIWKESGEKK
jgi:hypothetical protein